MGAIDVAVRLIGSDLTSGAFEGLLSDITRVGQMAQSMANSFGTAESAVKGAGFAFSPFAGDIGTTATNVANATREVEAMQAALRDANLEMQFFNSLDAAAQAAAGGDAQRLALKRDIFDANQELTNSEIALRNAEAAHGDALANLGTQMGILGGLTVAAGIAFAGFLLPLKTGLEAADQMQMSLTRLQIATESNAAQFPLLSDAVTSMATTSLFSVNDAALAFSRMTERGFSVKDVIYGIKAADNTMSGPLNSTLAMQGLGRQALALAEIMSVPATDGADLLAAALGTFKNSGMDAAGAANILAGAFYNGTPSAAMLTDAIQQGGAVANSMGVQFGDFATMLALLGSDMYEGSKAGTSLRYMITALSAPTDKAIKAMSDMGIMSINASGGYKQFEQQLIATGGATQNQINLWNGSVAGLKDMFTAAQGVGLVPLDATFNVWAEKNGYLNSKLFDSKGNFLGLKDAVLTLDDAMTKNHYTQQEKIAELTSLFNVRSGTAAMLLTNIKEFGAQYDAAWNKVHGQNALTDAQKILGTWQGATTEFKTSMSSLLAQAVLPFLTALTPLVQGFNAFIGMLNGAGSGAKAFLGSFLVVGTVISGITLVVTALLLGLTLLAGLLGVALAPLLAVIAGAFAAIVAVSAVVAIGINAVRYAIEQAHEKGTIFYTYLRPVLDWLNDRWKQFNDFIQQQFLPTFRQFEPVIKIVGIAFAVLAGVGVALIIVGLLIVAAVIAAVIIAITGIAYGILWLKDRIVEAWPHVIGFFQAIPGAVQAGLGAAGQWVKDRWNDIQNAFNTAINWIKNVVSVGFHALIDPIANAINTVVGWFNYLYQHSATFRGLVAAIKVQWDQLVADAKAIWDHLVLFLTLAWEGIKVSAQAIWHVLTIAWQQTWNAVSGTVTTWWGWVSGFFTTVWHAIVAQATDQWTNFVATFNTAVSWIKTAMGFIWDAITKPIDDLGSVLFNAGSNLIQMLGKGIQKEMQWFKDRLNDVAGAVKFILGWSSPTKEGPGADSDRWAPNLMRMLASGIDDGTPLVAAAATRAAASIKGAITPQIAASQLSLASSNASGAGMQPIIVQLDGKVIWSSVLDHGTGQMQMAGLNRLGR